MDPILIVLRLNLFKQNYKCKTEEPGSLQKKVGGLCGPLGLATSGCVRYILPLT